MNTDIITDALEMIENGMNALAGGPMKYYLGNLIDCYKLLIERFAPYKVGDTVTLAATPEISATVSWGWLGAKHFLVKGAQGEVRSVECDGSGFRFGIAFIDDSWVESHTKKVHYRAEKERYIFSFREEALVPRSALLPAERVCRWAPSPLFMRSKACYAECDNDFKHTKQLWIYEDFYKRCPLCGGRIELVG